MTRYLWLALALVACSKHNPYYCPDHPDQNCTIDAGSGSNPGCTSPDQCTGALPVCDLSQHICVQCTLDTSSACSGTTPICHADDMCHACTVDDECMSKACMPDGSCGTDTNVAYVAATGGDDTGPCTMSMPCAHVMVAVAKARPYVRIDGTIDEAVVLDNTNVTLVGGANSKLTHGTGVTVELRGTSTVTMRNLTITGGAGVIGVSVPAGNNVNLTLDRVVVAGTGGVGLNIQAGMLTMSRSVVSGNTGGGATIASDFRITNSLFVANGSGTSNVGGLQISAANTEVFQFNTVADNVSSAASISARGINCTLPMTLSNTIVHNNLASANCSFAYSLVDTGVTVTGPSNKQGDPMFANTNAQDPGAADFYRVSSASAAIDSGDPGASMNVDIDGNARPAGVTYDIGADEFMP